MSRKAKKQKQPSAVETAHAAGKQYVQDQIQSKYFSQWVWEQMVEAEEMRKRDPSSVIPLETKQDYDKLARNMLQQLGWDIKRDMGPNELSPLIDSDSREQVHAFFEGLDEELHNKDVRQWLADELIIPTHEEIRENEKQPPTLPPEQTLLPGVHQPAREASPTARRMRRRQYADWIADVADLMHRRGARYEGVAVAFWRQQYNTGLTPGQAVDAALAPAERRTVVRDYIAVDPTGRPISDPSPDYFKTKRHADKVGGYVKYHHVPSRPPPGMNDDPRDLGYDPDSKAGPKHFPKLRRLSKPHLRPRRHRR